MSRTTYGTTHLANRFPRVSGDEPRVYTIEDVIESFSPRERG